MECLQRDLQSEEKDSTKNYDFSLSFEVIMLTNTSGVRIYIGGIMFPLLRNKIVGTFRLAASLSIILMMIGIPTKLPRKLIRKFKSLLQ